MHGNKNTPKTYNKIYNHDDEIELIDLIRIIWKWKYLIVGGTLICIVAAIGISYVMPKIYLIDMVLKPGILSISNSGQKVYVDTPVNIKAVIESGAFDNVILKKLAEKDEGNIPRKLKFKVSVLPKANTFSVKYESSAVEQGIAILDNLFLLLVKEYSEIVNYFKDRVDKEIRIKKANVQKLENNKLSSQTNVQNIEKRIVELESEIVAIHENTTYLGQERNRFLSDMSDEKSVLSAILFSNTIQQNLQLTNTYKDQINRYKISKEGQLQNISGLEKDIQSQLAEIENLTVKRSNIKNIQTIKPPSSSTNPVKPRLLINVVLAFTVGMFFMFILSFFIEYISKNRQSR